MARFKKTRPTARHFAQSMGDLAGWRVACDEWVALSFRRGGLCEPLSLLFAVIPGATGLVARG